MSCYGETGDATNGATGDAIESTQPQVQASSEASTQKGKRKLMQPRSEVWDHFTKFINEKNEVKGKCNYREREFHCDSKKNGTTSLKNHMIVCKKRPPPEEPRQSHLNFVAHDDVVLTSWKFDQEATRKALACMIITDELPFKFVEGLGFKRLMSVAQPRFKIPSRWTVSRDCFGIYMDEKIKFKDYLVNKKQMVCLTTDTWTSIQRINYMCITVHFIDDNWKLNKRILNFIPISSHKGREIGIEIEKCLLEWGIDRVFTITVDNASSNDVTVMYLKEKISNWGCSIMKCKFLHMRCVAHIINLIVVDGLKEVGSSIKKVREAVRFVRQSPLRMRKFKESCDDEKIQNKQLLSLDVSTRWNSTYLMLETAQKFEAAFKRFEDKDPYFRIDLECGDGVPTADDWVNIRKMMMLLSHFYELILRISGSLYVTSHIFFHEIYMLYHLLDEWKKSDDWELAVMADKMKEKYDKYWGDPSKMNQLIYVATILDPRYKLEWVQYALCKMYVGEVGKQLGMQVKDVLFSLYNDYKEMISPSKTEKEQLLADLEAEVDNDDPATKVSKLLESEKKKFMTERLGGRTSRTEVERYLNEEIEMDRDDFNILNWWKLNSPRFPILSCLAKDVLAIPISTVASESTFSTGGRVLDAFRSSLTPKIVQSLICAQDWLRHCIPIEVEEYLDDVQRIEKDFQKITLESIVDIS